MKITRSIFIAISALALLAQCGGEDSNPLACDEDDNFSCAHQEESGRTFCDVDKAFPGTELKNECIIPPLNGCNRVEAVGGLGGFF